MRITKKAVSIILAIMMVASMMVVGAVSASATTAAVEAYDSVGNLVGAYETIDAAIEAGGDGCTVKLIGNLDKQQQINSQKTPVTLDLNGYMIDVEGGAGLNFSMGYYWNGDHIFTIKDSVGTGGINITPKYTGNACISDNTGRTIIVEGGTFTSTGKAIYCTASNATFTVEGGTFNGEVYVHDTGYGHGDLNITNGTINGDITVINNAELTVSGGTVNGAIIPTEGYDTVTVTGKDTIEDNGKIFVVDAGTATGAVAVAGGKGYTTLQAALTAAPANSTVTLVADIDGTSAKYSGDSRYAYFVTGKSDLTIDGNGHTVTVRERGIGASYTESGNGADLTFKNINIVNHKNAGRALDTRGSNINSLTLDNVKLICDGSSGYMQALTIGGDQESAASVYITGSEIQGRYAITTFNPVNMVIDDSKITGWACLNIKAADSSEGSHGSTFTVTDSELNSLNPFAGATNEYSLIKIEDDDISVDISDCEINVTGAENNQAIVACEDLDGNPTSNGMVTLGEGNVVTFDGDTSYVSVAPTDSDGMVITGGEFNNDGAYDYIADSSFATKKADGSVVVSEDVPTTLTSVDASDFNLGSKDINNYEIFGFQIKEGTGVRFVTAVNEGFLKGANIADYGYVLAKASGLTQAGIGDKFSALQYNGGNGEHTVSCMGTSNTLSGDYGKYSPSTTYKFVTAAVENMNGEQAVARFYIKTTDGNVYYANYINGTTYGGLLAELP